MNDTTDTPRPDRGGRDEAPRQKVAPFARYEGTSAWRKDRRRVRAYALFRAASGQPRQDHGASTADT